MLGKDGLLVFVMGVALVVGCSNVSTAAENKFYFYDSGSQQAFITKLKEKGIEYRVDGDGAVWYRAEDSAKVDQVKKEILDQNFSPYGVHYTREAEREIFIRELEKQGIEYEVKNRQTPSGQEVWVFWAAPDDQKVKIIQKKTREMMRNR